MGEKETKPPTTGEILIDIIEGSSYLFHDPSGTAWARIDGECLPVRSTPFRRRIQRKFYRQEDKAPHSIAMQDAIDQAEGKALFERNYPEEVSVRHAYTNKSIYIDLGNDGHLVYKVSTNELDPATMDVVQFYRPNGLLPLPYPSMGGSIDNLQPFLNFQTDSDFRLMVCWLLGALHPGIACPILVLQGEQGAAKSTTTRVLRALVDPNQAPIRTIPGDERELFIQAKNSGVLAYDNLSGVKTSVSDALCRICTGAGFSTRKLYTNDEEMIFQIRRPIILNGIDDIATRGDLLDRSIVLNLPAISPDKRKQEGEFWDDFEDVQPQILGALLKGLQAGLKYADDIHYKKLPRMADFAKFAAGCEKAYNWPEGCIIADYFKNRGQAVETGLDSDILASAIRKITEDLSEWSGTATELIEKIERVSGDVDSRYLPTTRTLKSRLTRLSPALRQVGITWERKHTESGSEYIIKKFEKKASEASVLSESNKNNGLHADGILTELTEPEHSVRKASARNLLGDNESDATEGTEAKNKDFLKKENARLEGYPFPEEEAPF